MWAIAVYLGADPEGNETDVLSVCEDGKLTRAREKLKLFPTKEEAEAKASDFWARNLLVERAWAWQVR